MKSIGELRLRNEALRTQGEALKNKKGAGGDGVFRYVFPMNAKQSSAARHAQYCSMQSVLSRLYADAKVECRRRNVVIVVSLNAGVDAE